MISALSGEGCRELVYAIMDYLDAQQRASVDEPHASPAAPKNAALADAAHETSRA